MRTILQAIFNGKLTILAVVAALTLALGSAALGADGDFFKVGKSNFASFVSKLVKNGPGPALELQVGSGPPLKVNSGAKVANLNVDRLDNIDSAGFYAAGSKVADSAHADNADSTARLGNLIYRKGPDVDVAANGGTAILLSPECPAGTRPAGGGVSNAFFGGEVAVSAPWPTNNPVQWWGAVQNHNGTTNSASIYVLCAPVGNLSVQSEAQSQSAAQLDPAGKGSTSPK